MNVLPGILAGPPDAGGCLPEDVDEEPVARPVSLASGGGVIPAAGRVLPLNPPSHHAAISLGVLRQAESPPASGPWWPA